MADPTPEDEEHGVTVEAVKAWLRVRDEVDDDLLAQVVAATNAWVAGLPVVTSSPATPWPDDVRLGATMLAARLYRRRNTPSGVESFTDQVVYLPRRDADVDMLLHIGFYALPAVG